MSKSANEAYELLEEVAMNNYQWPTERGQQKKVAGMMELDAISMFTAQVAALTKQLQKTTLPSQAMQCQAITLKSGTRYEEPKKNQSEEEGQKGNTQGIEEEKSNEEKVIEDLNKNEVVPPVSIEQHVRIPYPQGLHKHNLDKHFAKRKMGDYETLALTEECSAILQRKLPQKLGLGEARPTTVTLQLADRSVKHPRGIIEDVLMKVDKFIFPTDFIVLDMEDDENVPIILGRPFLATGQALIDVQKGELRLRVQGEEIIFKVFKVMTYPKASDNCFSVDVVEEVVGRRKLIEDPIEISLIVDDIDGEDNEEALSYLKWIKSYGSWKNKRCEELGEGPERPLPSILKPPVLELKALPKHL
ncbi:uncharacterized protein LOC133824344 [Humulus lupulus]|uniref:uncharacterized protein LOC133824344 n=1 Tax=Humulus lupulus TaxID=3486 RepID=UPI002B40D593|nr:uncharacterized protein LOC133824344 [Humulus lupulus]